MDPASVREGLSTSCQSVFPIRCGFPEFSPRSQPTFWRSRGKCVHFPTQAVTKKSRVKQGNRESGRVKARPFWLGTENPFRAVWQKRTREVSHTELAPR